MNILDYPGWMRMRMSIYMDEYSRLSRLDEDEDEYMNG